MLLRPGTAGRGFRAGNICYVVYSTPKRLSNLKRLLKRLSNLATVTKTDDESRVPLQPERK